MDTPITLIPYDDNYHRIAQLLGENYGVKVYEDLEFIHCFSKKLYEIFGAGFFARPNQFRKQGCWFWEFDEFLYIDTDIVVFEKIIDNLDYFKDYDFLCCDYQHTAGITNVFTPSVFEDGIFKQKDIEGIVKEGWWAEKKNLLSEQDLYDRFAECAAHPEYFDFSQKTSDQPIINYTVLKSIPRRFNIVHRSGKAPGSWAESSQFQRRGNLLFDPNCNQPLQYLHWAGIRLEPGCPYWEIWKHYRYLRDENTPPDPPGTKPESSWRKFLRNMKLS